MTNPHGQDDHIWEWYMTEGLDKITYWNPLNVFHSHNAKALEQEMQKDAPPPRSRPGDSVWPVEPPGPAGGRSAGSPPSFADIARRGAITEGSTSAVQREPLDLSGGRSLNGLRLGLGSFLYSGLRPGIRDAAGLVRQQPQPAIGERIEGRIESPTPPCCGEPEDATPEPPSRPALPPGAPGKGYGYCCQRQEELKGADGTDWTRWAAAWPAWAPPPATRQNTEFDWVRWANSWEAPLHPPPSKPPPPRPGGEFDWGKWAANWEKPINPLEKKD